MKTITHILVSMVLLLGEGAACAQVDGTVPPEKRQPPTGQPLRGDRLQEQVVKKLRQHFDEADADHDGWLTRAEAKQGGFGFADINFERIDAGRRGKISFEELLADLKRQAKP